MDRPYIVAWDSESDSLFRDHGGDRDLALRYHMQFTCICAASVALDDAELEGAALERAVTKHTFWRDDDASPNPVAGLLDLFDNAAAIVTYNGNGFDFPLIQRFYAARDPEARARGVRRYYAHRAKHIDVFERVRGVTDRWFKLDALLRENGLECKSGDGREAVTLWEAGRRDDLEAYCAQDVMLTLRLALKHGIRAGGVDIPAHVASARSFAEARLRDDARPRAKRPRRAEDIK